MSVRSALKLILNTWERGGFSVHPDVNADRVEKAFKYLCEQEKAGFDKKAHIQKRMRRRRFLSPGGFHVA